MTVTPGESPLRQLKHRRHLRRRDSGVHATTGRIYDRQDAKMTCPFYACEIESGRGKVDDYDRLGRPMLAGDAWKPAKYLSINFLRQNACATQDVAMFAMVGGGWSWLRKVIQVSFAGSCTERFEQSLDTWHQGE